MRTVINPLFRKLGDDAGNPTYNFTEPRVGDRKAEGEKPGDNLIFKKNNHERMAND